MTAITGSTARTSKNYDNAISVREVPAGTAGTVRMAGVLVRCEGGYVVIGGWNGVRTMGDY